MSGNEAGIDASSVHVFRQQMIQHPCPLLIFSLSLHMTPLSLFSRRSGELVALTTHFTDELMSQGLTKRILTLVSEINVTREFERLQKERGLGNEKHRKEVRATEMTVFLTVEYELTSAPVSRFLTSSKNADRPSLTVCFAGPVNRL